MAKITDEEIKEAMLSDESSLPDDIKEKLKSGELKLERAPHLHVDDLEQEVDEVLDALGFSAAFVSDMSRVNDFPLDDEEIAEAEKTLGVHIGPDEYLYQVAQRLKDSRE